MRNFFYACGAIRYTLDGSDPNETNGSIYSGPIHVSKTTVIKVTAYKDG